MASGIGSSEIKVGEKRKHRDEDLDSEFDFGSGSEKKTWSDDPLSHSRPGNSRSALNHSAPLPSKDVLVSERDREEKRARQYHYLAMDAYSRHKALVNHYILFRDGKGIEHFKRSTVNDRNDYTVLAEEHKFLWESEDETNTWEKRLAKAYYDKLFKEYAIADLSRYKENKVAMRWRTEKEVCDGKGQFTCGNKHCIREEELTSWEVNFSYQESSEHKNALVKLRLCRKCSKRLNYHKKCKRWGKPKSGKTKKKDKRHKKDSGKKRERGSPLGDEARDYGTSSDEDGSDEEKATTSDGMAGTSDSSTVWSKPAEAFLEKSKTEEFQEYFQDMFM